MGPDPPPWEILDLPLDRDIYALVIYIVLCLLNRIGEIHCFGSYSTLGLIFLIVNIGDFRKFCRLSSGSSGVGSGPLPMLKLVRKRWPPQRAASFASHLALLQTNFWIRNCGGLP